MFGWLKEPDGKTSFARTNLFLWTLTAIGLLVAAFAVERPVPEGFTLLYSTSVAAYLGNKFSIK